MNQFFIYADVPKETKAKLPKVSLPKDSYHVTLKFLGALDKSQQKQVKSTLKNLLKDQKDFTLKVKDYGTFHNRILHAEISRPEKLIQLKRKLNEAFGPDSPHRNYTPHITLSYAPTEKAFKPTKPKFVVSKINLSSITPPYKNEAGYTLKKRTRLEQFSDWIKNIKS